MTPNKGLAALVKKKKKYIFKVQPSSGPHMGEKPRTKQEEILNFLLTFTKSTTG